jgi:hypothetical protein
MFAQEQNGQLTPDQFNVWLLEPWHGNAVGSKLGTALSEWFVNLEMMNNLAEANSYSSQAVILCLSIGIAA